MTTVGSQGVTAVVVALGDSPRLEGFVDALMPEIASGLQVVIVVVGTDSVPACAARAGVRVVPSPMNVGWAGACHLGRLYATAPVLWFLQDDMRVPAGTARRLHSHLVADPELQAVRPVVTDEAGMVPAGSCGSYRTADGGVAALIPQDDVPADQFVPPPDQPYLPSSGLMLRAAAWDALGGFNPWLYPISFCDIELGGAMRRAGMRFKLATDARVLHAGRGSTPTPLGRFSAERNAIIYSAIEGDRDVDAPPSPLVAAHIVEAAVAYRGKPRPAVTAESIVAISGLCAGDALQHFARWQASGFDQMLAEYQLVCDARDWWREQAAAWERAAKDALG